MARIAFAGREVWPFVEAGGLGRYVWTAASLLAEHHEVTIVTTEAHASRRDDPRLPAGVAMEFVPEPEGDPTPMVTAAHQWSVRLLEAVRRLTPDVVEFADYLGEGFSTVHARRGGELRGTCVAVRAHASAEIVHALDERPAESANAPTWAFERFSVRHADALLWPGGDVLERYRAFYGRTAPGLLVPMPVAPEQVPDAAAALPPDGPLRLVYLGRLQRVKGVLELVDAIGRLPHADLRLTLVGGDTASAPGGGSMREHLLGLPDERVELREPVPHEDVPALLADHHITVVPTRWETYSYVTREALAVNRPVMATKVGAIPEAVIPGKSGWLAASSRPEDLAAALEGLEDARSLVAAGGPRAALEATIPSAGDLAAIYDELAGRGRFEPSRLPPVVDAVVAVQPGDADVELTLRSLAAQRGVRVAVTLVCAPDAVPAVPELLRALRVVVCAGDRVAMWHEGARSAPGDLLLLVPAGAELEPEFARRAAEALTEEFEYATSFVARGRRPWHAPLGGEAVAVTGIDSGASVALVRRGGLRPAGSERELWSGLAGVVVHEPLVRRLPRRASDSVEAPHAGAPSPDSVTAAFGDLLSAGAAA